MSVIFFSLSAFVGIYYILTRLLYDNSRVSLNETSYEMCIKMIFTMVVWNVVRIIVKNYHRDKLSDWL